MLISKYYDIHDKYVKRLFFNKKKGQMVSPRTVTSQCPEEQMGASGALAMSQ